MLQIICLLGILFSCLVAAVSAECLPCCIAEYLGNSGGEWRVSQVSGRRAVLLCPGRKSQSSQCPAESEQFACCLTLHAAPGNPRWENQRNIQVPEYVCNYRNSKYYRACLDRPVLTWFIAVICFELYLLLKLKVPKSHYVYPWALPNMLKLIYSKVFHTCICIWSILNPALFISMFTNQQSSSSLPLSEQSCVSWHITATCTSMQENSSEKFNCSITQKLHREPLGLQAVPFMNYTAQKN